MVYRFIFLVLIFSVYQQAYAAGAPGAACFTYEIFQHPVPPPGINQALVDYNYATIHARNAVIPPLGAGALQLGMSLRVAAPAVPWNHAIVPLGAPLNLQQACQVAIDRQDIGITIRFQNFPIIFAIAAGMPIPAGAAGYINHALRGGGYLSPLAAMLFRLRNNIPQPNFVIMPGLVPAIADRVIIHIHLPTRVSKNLKELSFNSILNPGVPGMAPYVSIKDMIDNQFAVLGLPLPHSGTIVSSDTLQPN